MSYDYETQQRYLNKIRGSEEYRERNRKQAARRYARVKDDPEFKAAESARHRARNEKRRVALEEALGGGCSCGATEDLHVHHRNHDGVALRKAEGALTHAKNLLEAALRGENPYEVELLCRQCHEEHHAVVRSRS